ncbi:MAG TPA: PQQ-binding-like beta-propeller repeat protein [Verrucomicrobiales bacterium]|nr:PQQ-binding-like beta-propeller repeat protein [Verrucomicrobiales bacterium]
MNHRFLSAFAIVSFAFTLSIDAQEWSRFRGIDGSGIGKMVGLKNQITPQDYAWSVPLEGVGHSSPVLWGEMLVLTIADADGSNRRIESFDATTGTRKWAWSEKFAEHNLHKFNNFASSTPVLDADRIYALWGSGEKTEAIALDHGGKLVWQREWPEFTSDHGFGTSPILSDGVLILHTDSVEKRKSLVMGLDPATGKSLWEIERITPPGEEKHLTAYSTPATLKVDGKEIVVVMQTNDGWKGLEPKTGKILWSYDGEYTQRSVGSIATGRGLVFATVGSGGQGRQATALRPTATGEPEVAFTLGLSDGLGYVPTPLFYEDKLYLWGDGGILTCLDAATGKGVYKERVGGNFFASPIAVDGKILNVSREGELVIVDAGAAFTILGKSTLDSGTSATPAVANNHLYLRTEKSLVCIPGS